MVIDKGLGISGLSDLMQTASAHIDFLKLGFGTSLCYPRHLLEEKIRLVRSAGVDIYPGGTLLEAALLQGLESAALEWAAAIGFSCIEISDGTVPISPDVRLSLIRIAQSLGLAVLTEVGKKDPKRQPKAETLIRQISADLEGGADKVIIEARESGKSIGIYDEHGCIKRELFNTLVDHIPVERIIWEAPQASQQKQLILDLGQNVNLGNIAPGDVLALEATRIGLRGDTLMLCTPEAMFKQAESA